MPHRHKPRRSKAKRMLVTTDNVVRVPRSAMPGADRVNMVPDMSFQAKQEVLTIIDSRYQTARDQTDKIAEQMTKEDKQYDGVWQDPSIDENQIFLPKTREFVKTVYSYVMLLVSQLDPLVTMQPQVSSIWASTEEYKRAKVAEALTQFHFDDLWKLRDDVFPRWLKMFLKHSMAVWKVTYREDAFFPDLHVDVVDRSLLYIDPMATDIRKARWIIERYFLPRSEVQERIDQGHWYLGQNLYDRVMFNTVQMADERLKRILGDSANSQFSVQEDELIEVWDYWQAPIGGLDDAYAVILGGESGELVRYGRNPFPYKGLPYRAKSYDPNEFRPDGTGMVEEYRPIQEVVNNFLNMRIMDVRKNIIRPVAASRRFITAETQEDFKNGAKIVRLSDEVMEAAKDPSFDLRKHFAELPIGTSTQELLVADLPFVLGQGKETANVSEVFRGQAPPHQATLGQVQEQLQRNQGVFRPVYMQVMRSFEEIAEICMEYFKDPDYFPTNRIIQIVGHNRYQDVISDWHNPGGNLFVREVSADEMDVDVTIDAVNGADALASRTFLMSSLEQIFQSIGQIPELYNELKNEMDFSRVVELMLNASGQDVEGIRLSPQAKQQKAAERQQMQQQAMQMQMQMEQMQAAIKGLIERDKAFSKSQAQIAVDSNRMQLEDKSNRNQIVLKHEADLDQMKEEIVTQLHADLVKMFEEAKLERQNKGSSVGHGNNVNQ